ncbi:MAG: AraC family transcriptional regulator [Oleispira sp.]
MMKPDNQFQYTKSQHLDHVSVLQAEMNNFSYAKHSHEEFSFGVTLAGRQDFFATGAFHRSYPGNIIVFNPGEVHDGQSGVNDTLRYRMLYVHPDQLEPLLNSAGVKQSKDFRIVESMLDDPLLRQHILSMALLIENKTNSKIQQECALYQMAVCIAQRHGESAPDPKRRKVDRLLLQAQDFIHQNIQSDMSLDDISQQANLSKYHFLRMFRQQFGITPHQYILNCRINRAREDLEAGALLNDVVFEYGFSDLSHFNRRFKPIYGMTPLQYQQHFLSA